MPIQPPRFTESVNPQGALPTNGLSDYTNRQGTVGQLANIGDLVGALSPYFNNLSNQNISSTVGALNTATNTGTAGQLANLQQLYNQYSTSLPQAAATMQQNSQEAAAQANANSLNSSQGQAAIQAALSADQKVNPNYYSTTNATASSLQDLMKSIDLSGQLSGSEQRAIGQSIAQQGAQNGTTNIPSATQTASNAMQYGNATYQRQETAKSDLSNAISKATSFIPTTVNPNVNAFNVGTGTQGGSNANALFQGGFNTGTSVANASVPQSNSAASLFSTGAGLQSGNNQLAAQASNSNNATTGAIIGGLGGILSSLI